MRSQAAVAPLKATSEIRWVPVSSLRIDPEAQRALRMPWVKAQISKFDVDLLGLPVVNKRGDGLIFVVDGQHRVALLREVGWGDQQVQVEYFTGLTQQEEAMLFLNRNNKLTPTPLDKFKVRVTAGEPVAVDINRIVTGLQLTIGRARTDGSIVAVAALEAVYNGGGILKGKTSPVALLKTLRTLKDSWGVAQSTFDGTLIEGVGLVLLKYGDRVDGEALVQRLAASPGGAPGLVGKARALREMRRRPLATCAAAVIVDIYNVKRREGKGKLADWWA